MSKRAPLNAGLSNTVRFSPTIECNEVPSHTNFSRREKRLSWFSDEEYGQMRRERARAIMKIRKNFPDTLQLSSVGLEHMKSTEHIEQCRIMRETVVVGVLDEQTRSKGQVEDNTEILAEVSTYYSKWSTIKAIERAQSLCAVL